jgi:hypothetical protein
MGHRVSHQFPSEPSRRDCLTVVAGGRVVSGDSVNGVLTGCAVTPCLSDPRPDVTLKAMRPPVRSKPGVLLNGAPAAAGRLGQADERRLKAVLGVCPMPLDADVHLVLCSFGRAGLAYVEADPAESDASTTVRNLLYGQNGHPCGWSQ